jgi:multidrug resistance protein, MATE family
VGEGAVSAKVPRMSEPHAPRISLGALLSLAWPIIVSRSTQVVIGLADALMVAHLGESALAATTAGALNVVCVLIFPMGISFIVASYSSQMVGRGDLVGARRYGFYGLVLAAGTQLSCMLLIPATPLILGWLPYTDDVRDLMTTYLGWRLISGGLAITIEALANYYGGLGRTRLPMIANVVAMVLNVFGNWVLIGGNLGAPALGVTGAAVASSIATSIAGLGLLAYFLWEGRRLGVMVPKLHRRELWRMLRFGVPSGLNWFFEFFAFNFFINVVVAGLGTTALAALMACFQIASVAFMPAFGLASAGAIIVGQAIGARRHDDVPKVVRLSFLTASTWQGLAALAYLTIPGLLMRPFVGEGESGRELYELGRHMLMLSSAWQLFDSAATALAESLRAAGDTAFTLWARLAIAWCIFVPGSYVTVRVMDAGYVVAVLWIVLYLGLLAAVLAARFWAGHWRNIQLIEELPA